MRNNNPIFAKIKSKYNERWALLIGTLGYLPASLILVSEFINMSDYLIQFFSLTILPLCFLIVVKRYRSKERTFNSKGIIDSNLSAVHRDLIIAEYEQICEEIRSREGQITNSVYFSLAALGLLFGIINELSLEKTPFFVQFGFYITLAFTFIIEEWVEEIEMLRLKQKKLENQSESIPFSISNIAEPRSSKGFLPFNTKDHTVEAFWFLTILWACGFVATIYLISFNIIE